MDGLEEDRSSNKVWREEHLTELFRILEPLSVKYIMATHLLLYLPFLEPHAGMITKAERRSAQEGTELLLELIKDSDEPEKWKTFTLALKRAEFLSLYKICHVCEKNDDFDFYIDIFELLSMGFASNDVDIVKLSQGMLQSESLTKEQFEQINFVFKEEGEIAAILEFFSCLPLSLEIWLNALQSCLSVLNKDLQKLIQKKGAEIHTSNNSDVGNYVKVYRSMIVEHVRPQDIIAYLKPHNLIPDMNVNSLSPCEKMRRILENIERSDAAGKWRTFLNALKHEGYESLHTKITNEEENIDDSQQICILKNVTPEILKSLTICDELLSDVKRDKLINERCYQEIKKKKQDSGEIAAAEMLLENIPRFKDGWFKRFLQILANVGQRNVVRKIDPDFQFSEKGKEFEGNNDGMERVESSDSPTEVKQTNEKKILARTSSGKNCIIYVFTGRNNLALDIIKMHLAVDEKHKVVYLGEPTSVKLQRHLLDTDDTNYQISDSTNDGFDSLENELLRNQVILLTKEDLTNSNLEKLLSHFSLLLIDECHLTIKKHPYNELMKNYIDHKLDNSSLPLPQVIGLTSFTDEKPKDSDQADDQIKMLCANLDCEELCTLRDDTNYFDCQIKSIPSNQSDNENPFKEKVKEIMRQVENRFQDPEVSAVIKEENANLSVRVNVHISNREGPVYTNWLAEIKKGFLSLPNGRIRSYCMCCWWFLNMLRNALDISTFCEIKHAFDYIEHELVNYKDDSKVCKDLSKSWSSEKDNIRMMSEKNKYSNCRLATLKSTIEEEIRKNSWSRIVVFVQTPVLVKIILNWMMNSEELRLLLPSKQEKSQVNHEVHEDILEIFDRRECRLCVAICEDSKVIQHKYNLRLDYFNGSFKDKYLQVESSASSGDNFNPELLLHKAMIEWKKLAAEDSEIYRNGVRKIQRDARSKRVDKGNSNPCRPLENKEFEIRCKNCKSFACFSSDIRTFKRDRFFVCNPNFLKDRKNKSDSVSNIECPKCYKVWGHISEDHFLLPELQINSFILVDVSRRQVNVNKWMSVPFYRMIPEATTEELEKMINR